MRHQVLKIGRWVVDFLFAPNGYDIEGVRSVLYECGASRDAVAEAEDVMLECRYNCGFTFTNQQRMRAVVAIGPTSSGDEFTDTLVHELHHLAVAIAANLGLDLEGEPPAYIAGDAARELASVICELGCRRCH